MTWATIGDGHPSGPYGASFRLTLREAAKVPHCNPRPFSLTLMVFFASGPATTRPWKKNTSCPSAQSDAPRLSRSSSSKSSRAESPTSSGETKSDDGWPQPTHAAWRRRQFLSYVVDHQMVAPPKPASLASFIVHEVTETKQAMYFRGMPANAPPVAPGDAGWLLLIIKLSAALAVAKVVHSSCPQSHAARWARS